MYRETARTEAECVAVFDWATAAACPLATETSNNCAITSDVTGVTFDLHDIPVLSTPTYDDTNNTVLVAVCAPLDPNKCGGAAGAGACLVRPDGSTAVLGLADDVVSLEDGQLSLSYSSGRTCGDQKDLNHTTVLSFVCSDDNTATVIADDDDCSTVVEIGTPRACEPQPEDVVLPCSFIAMNGDFYDLSPLTRKNEDNWQAFGNNGEHFIFNVCAELVPTIEAADCPENVGSCLLIK